MGINRMKYYVIIFRLRSNFAVFNNFFMVKLAVSSHFVHCCKIETMKHYLLDCQRYIVSKSKKFCNSSKLGLNEGDITLSILLSG